MGDRTTQGGMNRDPAEEVPRLVIVCGHPRSGTTLLTRLVNSHPDITLTYELRTFLGVGKPLREHLQLLRERNLGRLPPVRVRGAHRRWPSRVSSLVFLARYALCLTLLRREVIDLGSMRHVLRGIFPSAKVVGDKYPQYVFRLDQLTSEPGLLIVVIYRDARDVVRSTIEQANRSWRRTSGRERRSTTESAAGSWVTAIECMERNREHLHVIRYETLVEDPGACLDSLGAYLGVDPRGFRAGFVRQDRVGKHKKGMSEDDQAIVVRVAGETMRRLGYL